MAIAAGTKLRLTTESEPKPGAMQSALTAPGPVAVAATGVADGGSVPLIPIVGTGTRPSYWGFAYNQAVAAGDQPSLANGAIVEGFTGVTPGSLVFVSDTGTLTHTLPAGLANADAIGIGVRSTAIYFFDK